MNQLIKYNEHMEVTYDVILLNKDKPKLIGYSDFGGSSINTNHIEAEYFEYYEDPGLDKADKLDYTIAASSGLITGLIDIFWVKEFSIERAHLWGKDKTDEFVLNVAQKLNKHDKESKKEINTLKDAIEYLECKFPLPSDGATSDLGGPLQHHLRDFSHHPTIVGLIFSILTQFTGCAYGTDTDGNFKTFKIKNPKGIEEDILLKIFKGTTTWAFHLISDMAGSSSHAGYGTGIPGVFLSHLKELSALPIVKEIKIHCRDNNISLSQWISKLFNGSFFEINVDRLKDRHRFDLRFEMGLINEVGRQALPVLINECLVRSFYSVDRFFKEVNNKSVKTIGDVKKIDPNNFLPINNRALARMITVSSGVFLILDVAGAKFKAKNKLDFVLGINFVGVGRFVFAVVDDYEYLREDVEDAYYEYMKKHNKEFYENDLNKSRLKHLVLSDNQTRILFSLQQQAVLYDIENNKGNEEVKEKWLEKWKTLVAQNLNVRSESFFIDNEKEIYHSINEESLNDKTYHWLELIVLEMINFNPYVLLNEEDLEEIDNENFKELKKLRFKNNYILERFAKMQFVMGEDEVKDVINLFNQSKNKLTNSWSKIALGLGGTALIATLSGGLAFVYAPQIAILLAGSSTAGLSGAALTNASLAVLGGGSLAAGGAGMAGGTTLIAGGGALMGSLGTGALAAATISTSKEFTLMECSKLLTYSKLIVDDQPEAVEGIYLSSKTMIDNMKIELEKQEKQLKTLNFNINNSNIINEKDKGLLKANKLKIRTLKTFVKKIETEAKKEERYLDDLTELKNSLSETIETTAKTLKKVEEEKETLENRIKETKTSTLYFERFEGEMAKMLKDLDNLRVVQIEA